MIKFQSKKTLERIKSRLTNLVFVEPKQDSRDGLVEKLLPGAIERADKPSAASKVYFRQTRSSNLLRTFNRTAKSPGLSSTGASSNANNPVLTGDSFFQTTGSFGLGFPRFDGPDRVIATSSDLKSPVSPRKLTKKGSRRSVVDPDIQGELARVSSTFHMVKLIEDIGSLRQENKLFSEELMKVEMEAERREKQAKSKVLRKERIQGCYEALQPTQRARELLIEAGASLQPELVP